MGVYRTGSTGIDSNGTQKFAHFIFIGYTANLRFEQIRFALLAARQRTAHSDEVDAFMNEFAANLIDRPIRIRKQEDRRVGFEQLLLQRVEHTERGLARAWRSDYKEEVARLFHAE